MNKLYDIKEVAEILHISKSTLYRWIHYQKIEHTKIGSRVLFSEESLQKLIKKNTINSE